MCKVLVVDDQEDVRKTLRGVLQDAGYSVEVASNPTDALELFFHSIFDFAIIDIRLFGGGEDDNSGITLAMTFNHLRSKMGIILLTKYVRTRQIVRAIRYHGILDFIEKTPDFDTQIIGALKDAREDIKKHQYSRRKGMENLLSISLYDHLPVVIRAYGGYRYSGLSATELNLDFRKHTFRANTTLIDLNHWRESSRYIGAELWKDIFEGHPELMYVYGRLQNTTTSIRFETHRKGLSIPLEFIQTNQGHLVLQHPVTRMVSNVGTSINVISPEWLAMAQELNILLIASNTIPSIPGVDSEIKAVADYLESQRIIPVRVKVIPTEQATYDVVRQELTRSKYDIVHYAGHGIYDEDLPEDSSIHFWSNQNKSGKIVSMRAPELAELLNVSATRFLYLSCCFGGLTASLPKPNDDFLGLADAVIQAGIPSVLGFRAPVSDKGGMELSKAFYEGLLECGHLAVALWHARRHLAISDRDDPAWLSPILISQH
jgi:ActR/RegA family two-component response regulator